MAKKSTGTEVAVQQARELTPQQTLAAGLDKMRPNIAELLPPGVPIDRFMRVAKNALQSDPYLLDADRQSLFQACLRAAQDGLMADGREGKIVTFNTKKGGEWVKMAQFMPMVYGIRKRLLRHGILLDIQLVYEGEPFKIVMGEHPHIEHERLLAGRGEVVGGYAIARLPESMGGGVLREFMHRDAFDSIKARTKSRDKQGNITGPWLTDEEEMQRKTLAKRVEKLIPVDDEVLHGMIQRDNEDDFGPLDEGETLIDPPTPSTGRPSALKRALGKTAEPEQDDTPPADDEGADAGRTIDHDDDGLDEEQGV